MQDELLETYNVEQVYRLCKMIEIAIDIIP